MIVKSGGISKDIINFTAEMYASYIKDDDTSKDEKGSVTIKKDLFLKNIVDEDLNGEQKERLDFVGQLILTKVVNLHKKSNRRMSLSLKRQNPDEAIGDDPKKLDSKESPKTKV